MNSCIENSRGAKEGRREQEKVINVIPIEIVPVLVILQPFVVWIWYKFCKPFCLWRGYGFSVVYLEAGWGARDKMLLRTRGQHRAGRHFKAVLLPGETLTGETLIQFEHCRQGSEDRLVQCKLVCWHWKKRWYWSWIMCCDPSFWQWKLQPGLGWDAPSVKKCTKSQLP